MARSKQEDQNNKTEGAFGKKQPSDQHDPLTVSGATPSSTPAPGKSKSSQPHDVEE